MEILIFYVDIFILVLLYNDGIPRAIFFSTWSRLKSRVKAATLNDQTTFKRPSLSGKFCFQFTIPEVNRK